MLIGVLTGGPTGVLTGGPTDVLRGPPTGALIGPPTGALIGPPTGALIGDAVTRSPWPKLGLATGATDGAAGGVTSGAAAAGVVRDAGTMCGGGPSSPGPSTPPLGSTAWPTWPASGTPPPRATPCSPASKPFCAIALTMFDGVASARLPSAIA